MTTTHMRIKYEFKLQTRIFVFEHVPRVTRSRARSGQPPFLPLLLDGASGLTVDHQNEHGDREACIFKQIEPAREREHRHVRGIANRRLDVCLRLDLYRVGCLALCLLKLRRLGARNVDVNAGDVVLDWHPSHTQHRGRQRCSLLPDRRFRLAAS